MAGPDDLPSLACLPAPDFTRTRVDLERLRSGDAAAFDDLWRRYRPALEVMIAGRIRMSVQPALRHRLDAEDVVQDVAITIFGKLHEFEYRGRGSVLAWMAKIAERTISDWVDYWRASKRHPGVERPPSWRGANGTTRHFDLASTTTTGHATKLTVRAQCQRLGKAIATLPEREHLIVLWRFFGDAQWDEIAGELGAPSPDAVRKECYLKVIPALAAALAKS